MLLPCPLSPLPLAVLWPPPKRPPQTRPRHQLVLFVEAPLLLRLLCRCVHRRTPSRTFLELHVHGRHPSTNLLPLYRQLYRPPNLVIAAPLVACPCLVQLPPPLLVQLSLLTASSSLRVRILVSRLLMSMILSCNSTQSLAWKLGGHQLPIL